MKALDRISAILSRCGHTSGVMPPTALFNKEWMLRLLLDWFASPLHTAHQLSPASGAKWYSEGLLASRFFGGSHSDSRTEGFTNADGVIGHFHLGAGGRGDVLLDEGATQFVVIEAKLGSALSLGTKNAPNFDQAARNVACMAHLLEVSKTRSESLTTLSFHVLAPAKRIKQGIFSKQLAKEGIRNKVCHRAESFGTAHKSWITSWFEPALERMTISAVSWEDLISTIRLADELTGLELEKFYSQCLIFNPPRLSRPG